MSKIISVIPNICEGKNEAFIDSLSKKLINVKGLVMLDVSMDKVRNRTVFAFTGSTDAIIEGGMVLYEESLKNIDMRKHKGEYPRIGAVDVFPFVPLKDVPIEEAVAISEEFAQRVAEEFKIPVYLFSESAKYPLRKDIEKIREVQYEGLEKRLKDPRWKPDFGPDEFKADSGATIIGARYPLVSFKIFLNTTNLDITRNICEAIDHSSGGLRNVKTYSGIANEKQQAQITISISNYKVTPMYKVIEFVRMEARRYGLTVQDVEMIGLIPERVFLDSAKYYMNVNHFSYDRVVEKNIQQHLDEKMFDMD